MNRAEKMLEVLKDGQRHSRLDIFERVGWLLTNNGAAELRELGYDVEHTQERIAGATVHFYRIRNASLNERDPQGGTQGGPDGAPLDSAGPESSRSLSEATSGLSVARSSQDEPAHDPIEDGRLEQASLFSIPATPEWA